MKFQIAAIMSDSVNRKSMKMDTGVVKEKAKICEIPALAPHDLRRTCARLCHQAGGKLELIQFLLGHVSVQTTERYLGCMQRFHDAVNDRLGIEPDLQNSRRIRRTCRLVRTNLPSTSDSAIMHPLALSYGSLPRLWGDFQASSTKLRRAWPPKSLVAVDTEIWGSLELP